MLCSVKTFFLAGWVNCKQNGVFIGSKPKRGVTGKGVTEST